MSSIRCRSEICNTLAMCDTAGSLDQRRKGYKDALPIGSVADDRDTFPGTRLKFGTAEPWALAATLEQHGLRIHHCLTNEYVLSVLCALHVLVPAAIARIPRCF